MAEILVKAKKHWMDDFTKEKIGALTPKDKRAFDARYQIGDPIVVRPDGWPWGKEECAPNFWILKVPGVTEEELKYLEDELFQDEVVAKSAEVLVDDWANEAKKSDFISMNGFTAVPELVSTRDVTTAKGRISINTVQGSAIETYTLRCRKHQLDASMFKVASNSRVEIKDKVALSKKLTVNTNTQIVETVWKPKVANGFTA